MLEITIAGFEGLLVPIAQVARRDDAEGANRRERARLGAAQGDVMVTDAHAFTVGTSWQIEVLHEHIAGIERGALARIRRATTTALAQLTPLIAVSVAGVVRPTRIKVHGDLLHDPRPAVSIWLARRRRKAHCLAGCGRSWRPDTSNHRRVRHLGAVLVWPLLWPLCGQNWRFETSQGNSRQRRASALSDRIRYGCEDS